MTDDRRRMIEGGRQIKVSGFRIGSRGQMSDGRRPVFALQASL